MGPLCINCLLHVRCDIISIRIDHILLTLCRQSYIQTFFFHRTLPTVEEIFDNSSFIYNLNQLNLKENIYLTSFDHQRLSKRFNPHRCCHLNLNLYHIPLLIFHRIMCRQFASQIYTVLVVCLIR